MIGKHQLIIVDHMNNVIGYVGYIMSFMYKLLSVSATILVLSSCGMVYGNKHVEYKTVEPAEFPVLTAIGHAPISLQKSTNKTQRMLMAIKASKLAAYSELAEQVHGQQVSQKTTMADLLISNSQLSTKVSGVIRGAKVVKSYPAGDLYITELSLDYKDVYELYISTTKNQKVKQVTYY